MTEQKEKIKQLKLGVQVDCLDGKAGKVSKLIADPESRRAGYLVVKMGVLRRREVVVPVSLVSEVTPEKVLLGITRKTLNDFPDYEITVRKGSYEKSFPASHPRPIGFYTPPANEGYLALRQRSVPDKSVAVKQGMLVRDRCDDPIGKVKGVILEAEDRSGEYIVFRNDHTSVLHLIPAALVEAVSSTGVKLHIDARFADGLPTFLDELADRIVP